MSPAAGRDRIVVGLQPRGVRIELAVDGADTPFDAERRRTTAVYATDDGAIVFCKGALETLLPLCATRDVAGAVEAVDEEEEAATLTEAGWRPLWAAPHHSFAQTTVTDRFRIPTHPPPRPHPHA